MTTPTPKRTSIVRFIAALALLAPELSGSRVLAREPIEVVPADALLCWYGRPHIDISPDPNADSDWNALLDLGVRLAGAPLDAQARVVLRSMEMLNAWIRYPHALALIDTAAKSTVTNPEAKRVDRMRFVLVARTDGKNERFLRIIQKAVNEQTDAGQANIKRCAAGDWRYDELRDKRLPEWCVISWGQIDDLFVFTVGEDVWPLIAAIAGGERASLATDPWNAAARSKHGASAMIEIFVAMNEIRGRLDPFLSNRATEFFKAWRAENIDQAHWALGFKGRALYCDTHFRTGDETTARLFADPDESDPRLLATIPEDARYAIYRVRMGDVFPRLVQSVIATRDPDEQQRIARTWAQIEKEHGIHAQRDLLDQLGESIVLHNDPPHPLRLPMAMTSLTEITGDARRVRDTIDRACGKLKDAIDEAAAEGKNPPISFQHGSDGVWSLNFGPLAGPAWIVTDRFVITSWSPFALRAYLQKIGDKVGRYTP